MSNYCDTVTCDVCGDQILLEESVFLNDHQPHVCPWPCYEEAQADEKWTNE